MSWFFLSNNIEIIGFLHHTLSKCSWMWWKEKGFITNKCVQCLHLLSPQSVGKITPVYCRSTVLTQRTIYHSFWYGIRGKCWVFLSLRVILQMELSILTACVMNFGGGGAHFAKCLKVKVIILQQTYRKRSKHNCTIVITLFAIILFITNFNVNKICHCRQIMMTSNQWLTYRNTWL